MKNITDMKTLKEALFNKKNLKNGFIPYDITKDDMIGQLEGFPVGVVVRMMEEQEKQRGRSDIGVFQRMKIAPMSRKGFIWLKTEAGHEFWEKVIVKCDFDLFFKKYPEYEKYN